MENSNHTQIIKDLPNNKIIVTREFAAAPEQVWFAWTESELLDQWWAPKPYRAETKSLDFKVGGHWLYAMVGPDNSKIWCKVDYTAIKLHKSFELNNFFCDENGVRNSDFPMMYWKNEFNSSPTGTKVIVEILFATKNDLEKIVELGFEVGFTAALTNLDQYIEAKFKIRNE